VCKSVSEPGGPRRCSGDARAAAERAHDRVAVLEAERDAAAADLFAHLPAEPTVAELTTLHPENADLIREMSERGVRVGLSGQYRDADGRPMLTFGSPDTEPDTPREPVSFADMSTEDRVKAMHAEVEAGIDQLGTAQGWQQFLQYRASFHRYSLGNQMLIAVQRPGATLVAGYHDWRKRGRSVAGEKAIWINAPKTRRVKEIDPATGKETERRQTYGFRPVPVFDVSQTKGDPIPAAPAYIDNPLSGMAPPRMHENLVADIGHKGFNVEYGDTGSAEGWTDFNNRKVVISKSASHRAQAATLAHELAHIELGHDGRSGEYHSRPGGRRPDMEVEAESVAYVIGRHYGMSDHASGSFAYIDGWARGDKAKVKATADAVVTASTSILDRIIGKASK
jgi:hypothetical protein